MNTGGPPIVIGVGEEFLHDDGAGPAVIAELRRLAATGELPPDTRLETCFGEPTGLIELWRGSRLAVVVDAAAPDPQAGLTAGDVLRWEEGAAAGPPPALTAAPGPAATHGLGPGAAIALGSVLDRLPGRLVLFAVVGGDFSLGPGLSAPVAEAVRRVAGDITQELRRQAREGLSALTDRDVLSWPASPARPTLKT